MKTFKQVSLFLVLMMGVLVSPAYAQEGDPVGPQYVVQSGDTLSSIALRFDISIAEVISENDLSDPDSLNVGDLLVLPGIDWIDGTLVIEELPLGESYLSLRRKYNLSKENFARLNRISSPNQLHLGFSALLATERGENLSNSRSVVAAGQSLLEMALISGDNPWALVSRNQLLAAWDVIPGDVLFSVNREQEGPGALPSPIRELGIEAPGFIQGKTAIINVSGGEGLTLGGKLIEKGLHFFENGTNEWVALQGVSLESSAGSYEFVLSGEVNGVPFGFSQIIRVQNGAYQRETLTVDPELLDPELSSAESKQLRPVFSEASPEKMWQGYWGAPHPYINVVNSEFGVQRSYNGGSYENFHYGIDFGGGVGIEIWAPAPGKVVFADLLTVRGNSTIIDHGWGIYSAYFHQSEIKVEVGDVVETGQIIGLVGNTGRSSGAHLHWEIWANGVPVQPMDWINLVFP